MLHNVVLVMCVCVLVAQSCPTLCDLWTAAHQAPLSIGFSKQTWWSGLLFTSPLDPPYPGIKPRSPTLQAVSLLSEPPEKPIVLVRNLLKGSIQERLSRILRRYMDTYMYTLSKPEIFAMVKKSLLRTICIEKMQK